MQIHPFRPLLDLLEGLVMIVFFCSTYLLQCTSNQRGRLACSLQALTNDLKGADD